jgi:hypothetical protein
MILDRVDAAPGARDRKPAKSGRYNGADRIRFLRFLRVMTVVTAVAAGGLILKATLL